MNDKSLSVRCQTCGAAPGQKCELTSGQPRNESHRARREAVNHRPGSKPKDPGRPSDSDPARD